MELGPCQDDDDEEEDGDDDSSSVTAMLASSSIPNFNFDSPFFFFFLPYKIDLVSCHIMLLARLLVECLISPFKQKMTRVENEKGE